MQWSNVGRVSTTSSSEHREGRGVALSSRSDPRYAVGAIWTRRLQLREKTRGTMTQSSMTSSFFRVFAVGHLVFRFEMISSPPSRIANNIFEKLGMYYFDRKGCGFLNFWMDRNGGPGNRRRLIKILTVVSGREWKQTKSDLACFQVVIEQ